MRYDHAVKHNGVYYPTGSEVPNDTNAFTEPTKNTNDNHETENDKQYTKTEINRMSTAELKDLAVSVGISDAGNKTGGELKKSLIEFYGL